MRKTNGCYSIAYSSSDAYSWIAGVSLKSLFDNNKGENFTIHYLCNNVSNKNKELLKKQCEEYGYEIYFYDIEKFNNKYYKHKIDKKWDFATFGRLFEAEILPSNVLDVLHIDCDTIINKNISDLLQTDMTKYAVAGVKECLSKRYCFNIGVDDNKILINAGVLIFNLDYFRKNFLVQRFYECLNNNDKLKYLDQDVLNICIKNEELKILDLRFNAYSVIFYFTYKQLLKLRSPSSFYNESEYLIAINSPSIIHFTTCRYDFGRPWNFENNHPLKKIFNKYLNESIFFDKKMIHIKKDLKIIIARHLPKWISINISNFVNQKIKPLTK